MLLLAKGTGSHEKNLFLTLSPVMTSDASVSPAAWSLRNCSSISSRAGRSYRVKGGVTETVSSGSSPPLAVSYSRQS